MNTMKRRSGAARRRRAREIAEFGRELSWFERDRYTGAMRARIPVSRQKLYDRNLVSLKNVRD